jgi:hypothetical protein
MMQARHNTAPHGLPTRTHAMNHDLKNFITSVVVRAVLPTLMLVAAVAFFSMPYTLGHHPGEAGTTGQIAPQMAARHMT